MATFITKPRRWGKSINLDMLKTFLEIEVDEYGNKKFENSNKMLFTGEATSLDTKSAKNTKPLKISQINNSEYMEYQGKYHVIFVDLRM
ncbi:MAG: hypothetical protein MRQ09_02205 [Candidatus Midichloria sp.]|nr:hypothetical protein [Candidatus Midichloria sp.]